MKRIVLCLDGTWNQVKKGSFPTNVVRLAQAVADRGADGIPQVVYYNAGVGTGGPVDRFLGGFFGVGLFRNVQRAYAFCALNYRPGDEIYIFGFSRGAYTARAVAGIINKVGLVPPAFFDRFDEVWTTYRSKDAPSPNWIDDKVPIHCVGVWDTVGSYGIPGGFDPSSLARSFARQKLGFRDTNLGRKVKVALHAVAVDEQRRPFAPTFWTKRKERKLPDGHVCEQVWFAGVHSNVGGSYEDHELSDVTLLWMIARVEELTGLRFELSGLRDRIKPVAAAATTNSMKWYYLLSRARPLRRLMLSKSATTAGFFWNTVDQERENINERIHWTVAGRFAGSNQPLYRPRNYPSNPPPESVSKISDREKQLWNELGVNIS